jgi:hypothetical protein
MQNKWGGGIKNGGEKKGVNGENVMNKEAKIEQEKKYQNVKIFCIIFHLKIIMLHTL